MDVLLESDQQRLQELVERLHRDANALAVLLLNRDGQEMARAGQTTGLDITSLSSLFAGNVAATSEIAKLLKEKEFEGQFHEGSTCSIHLSVVAHRAILVVLFNQQSSLGLVRLRVRRATEDMARVLTQPASSPVDRMQTPFSGGAFADAELDRLFGGKR